jgi:hypothetical protein
LVAEESALQPALERLATAIELEVADRKGERQRHEEAQQREAALLSALLLFVVSIGCADIAVGDPISKSFLSHQAQLPVIIPVALAAIAFLYKAFQANVISLRWSLYGLLFMSTVAGFLVFLMRGQTPRVAGSLIFAIVFYQFIKYYVPTDQLWRERLDRFDGWVNSNPWLQSVRAAIIALSVFAVLFLIWIGYLYGVVPDQVGWAYVLIAWVLFYGIPMWERLWERYRQPRKGL